VSFRFYSFLKPGYIPNVTEPAFNVRLGPNAKSDNMKAAAAIGPLNNPRIIKQAGTFTVFPRKDIVIPLNLFRDSSNYLYKIVINRSDYKKMKEQLLHYGLTENDLFPGIEKVAEDITQELKGEGLIPS
jgi:hypothetical protein